MEAETDSQMQSEIGSDFSEEALGSCSMTGSHESRQLRFLLMLYPVKCKSVNRAESV